MKINKADKYRIYPNKQQQEILEKHFGCCRFVYNHFLRQRIDHYTEHGKGLSYYDNARALTHLKRQEGYEWLKEVNSQSLQQSLKTLDTAYKNFFRRQAKFPRFKKRRSRQSFCIPQHFSICGNKLDIPKCGGIKIKIHRRIEGVVKSITISRTPSGKYFASIMCETDIPEPAYTGSKVGIDFGIKSFITTSEAETIDPPEFLRKSEKQLRRLQRRVSRKAKGSENRKKAIIRLSRQHEKVSNQRQDFLHKTSRQFVSENQAICIENLAIRNMIRNHHLAKSMGDSGWNMFVKMLKYKGQWYGCHVYEIDRFFPSSKRCHVCGYINEALSLGDRHWRCPQCSVSHDRDHNAAINILSIGLGQPKLTPVEKGVQLTFEFSPSMKQEAPSVRPGCVNPFV